jgi:hypothetical protein
MGMSPEIGVIKIDFLSHAQNLPKNDRFHITLNKIFLVIDETL